MMKRTSESELVSLRKARTINSSISLIDNGLFSRKLTEGFPSSEQPHKYLIIYCDQFIGSVQTWHTDDSTVTFSARIDNKISDKLVYRMFLAVTAEIEKSERPARITCIPKGRAVIEVLSAQGYYAKGRGYQKIPEEWRYLIDDCCFDSEGFIVDQGRIKLPFGFFRTDTRGCGWIAAYNLMKVNEHVVPMKTISSQLSRFDPTGKVIGQGAVGLYFWLRQQDLPVRMVPYSRNDVIQKINQSKSGILLYIHARGSHYTTYRKLNDGKFHFYNAVYGISDMNISVTEFMQRYSTVQIGMIIYVPDLDGDCSNSKY